MEFNQLLINTAYIIPILILIGGILVYMFKEDSITPTSTPSKIPTSSEYVIAGLTNQQYESVLRIIYVFALGDGLVEDHEILILGKFFNNNMLMKRGINLKEISQPVMDRTHEDPVKESYKILDENIPIIKTCKEYQIDQILKLTYDISISDGDFSTEEKDMLDYFKEKLTRI